MPTPLVALLEQLWSRVSACAHGELIATVLSSLHPRPEGVAHQLRSTYQKPLYPAE